MDIVLACVALILASIGFISLTRPRDHGLCLRCQGLTQSLYGYVTSHPHLRRTPYLRHVDARLKDICSQCGTPYLRYKT